MSKMGSILYSKRHKPRIGRGRATRPKTFKTEDAAKNYAKENKIEGAKITKLQETKFRVDTE